MRRRLTDLLRPVAKEARGALIRHGRPTRWHELRRLEPIDRRFGMSRGTPIDRAFIARFLDANEAEVRGHVLEVGDARYTRQFGRGRVVRSSVLHAEDDGSEADVVGDLAGGLPGYEGSFDCLILTQVLPFIYDLRSALATIRGLCRSGGTVLATLPGISQISRYDMDRWGDFWRFTELSAQRLFSDEFGSENVEVVSYGNVLTAVALLHGIAAEELTAEELSAFDPDYPVIVGIVARAAA